MATPKYVYPTNSKNVNKTLADDVTNNILEQAYLGYVQYWYCIMDIKQQIYKYLEFGSHLVTKKKKIKKQKQYKNKIITVKKFCYSYRTL